jgi:hypothetical protein
MGQIVMRIFLLLAGLVSTLSTAHAEDTVTPGDFYLISRQIDGKFHGSHRVLEEEAAGYVSVVYCGRIVWVRPKSVAWTQIEAENKRLVGLEYSNGRGWVEVCPKAERQVGMPDIGIDEDPLVVSNDGIYRQVPENRFSKISKAFSTKGKTGAKASYHE